MNELVPRREVRVARSFREARPEDLIMIGPEGELVGGSTWGSFRTFVGAVGVIGGMGMLAMGVGAILAGPIGMIGSALAVYVGTAAAMRPQVLIAEATRALVARDLDKVERIARRAEVHPLSTRVIRMHVDSLRSGVAWLRGHHLDALRYTRRALERLPGPNTGPIASLEALLRLNEVQLLALTEGPDRAEIQLLEIEPLPAGDVVQMELKHARLLIAFERGRTDELQEEELLDWSRDTLDTNRWGATLVLMAWALDRHGQVEFAKQVLEVARDRLHEYRLDLTHPRLWNWMRGYTGEAKALP